MPPKPPKGFDNFDQWLSGTQLERELKLQEYSVSNRGLRPNFVGTPEQVRERIEEYEAAGLDLLLLQMSPQAEEMDRFAEQVIEPMRARSAGAGPERNVKRRFDKMHGLGNDFVIVDAREGAVRCDAAAGPRDRDRRTGVGCDQLIVLEPSDNADLKMRIWNSDGGEVESCGNATRCVVQLTGARTIETDGGLLEGEDRGRESKSARGAALRLGQIPLAYAMDTTALPMAWDGLEQPFAVNVGNPHLVFFVPMPRGAAGGARAADRERSGLSRADQCQCRNLRRRPLEAADIRARRRRDLACGTGACASAVAAIVTKRAAVARAGRHDRRYADDHLGAGRADPHARRARPTSSAASST